MLQGYYVKDSVKELHKIVLCTLIGNTDGNADVICIRFYALTLMKERGLRENHANTPKTYETCGNKTNDQLIKSHGNTILTQFNIPHNPENECLSSMYLLPNMYKNPAKTRFIIPAPNCSLEPLSKSITSVFKLFFQQIESYNK